MATTTTVHKHARTTKSGGWSAHGRRLRIEGAKARQTERAKRTPEEQLERLDARNGVGQGAQKERARLMALIAPLTKPEPPKTETMPTTKPETEKKTSLKRKRTKPANE